MPEISVKGIYSILLAFTTAVIITWYYLPRIIKVVTRHNISDKPIRHKIHKVEVPTLGGIAIFAGFTIAFLISVNGYLPGISYFTAASMLIFFVGITDDLLYLRPKKKLFAEIGAVLLLVLFTELRFTNLHGFLGISTVPAWISYLITVFLIIVIINAVNLIDGIDGLASSIGIIASTAFGIWFFLSGETGYTVVAAALAGSLLVFIKFNISKGRDKIFMGDSGSLVIGFTLAVFAVHFNELNLTDRAFHRLSSSPSVSIAILIIPLFDTLRVVALRLRDHQHPFVADNRHMHHMLLRAGFSHIKATFIISGLNIFIIAVAFALDHIGILYLGLILLTICMLFMWYVMKLIKRKELLEKVSIVLSHNEMINIPDGVKIEKPVGSPKEVRSSSENQG
jgi:UDP-N-acetylmuramyl pentapeptide phosphotransferase/UDP-N-acetylglucosamine-1-phosphate transferase